MLLANLLIETLFVVLVTTKMIFDFVCLKLQNKVAYIKFKQLIVFKTGYDKILEEERRLKKDFGDVLKKEIAERPRRIV